MAIRLFNTLGLELQTFDSIEKNKVSMYHCGPTVYGIQHIGNLSMFVFTDILRRTLEYSDFEVNQVINITDFGHLTSDADEGEDKMTKGLKQEGLEPNLANMRVLAEKYADIFFLDLQKLNVRTKETKFPFASDYVEAQITMIKELEEKGFTYTGEAGVYFDTFKFPDYGKLGNINLGGLEEGARIGVTEEKKSPTDFLLWKSGGMGWESPWGKGFPGWHIECSAMIRSILGDQIDIHTGGIEHIPVHHNNEIAQTESATGKKPFSKFWLHRAHLQINSAKIAKSDGNTVYLSEIIEKGFSPLTFRYFLLLSNYRTPTNFTWEALEAAENAYKRLKTLMILLENKSVGEGQVDSKYKQEFLEALENDLNTPEALAVVWKLAKNAGDDISYADARATLLDFDQVLGLKLNENEYAVKNVPHKVQILLDEREKARLDKNFVRADEIRGQIKKEGFEVKDTGSGQELEQI